MELPGVVYFVWEVRSQRLHTCGTLGGWDRWVSSPSQPGQLSNSVNKNSQNKTSEGVSLCRYEMWVKKTSQVTQVDMAELARGRSGGRPSSMPASSWAPCSGLPPSVPSKWVTCHSPGILLPADLVTKRPLLASWSQPRGLSNFPPGTLTPARCCRAQHPLQAALLVHPHLRTPSMQRKASRRPSLLAD